MLSRAALVACLLVLTVAACSGGDEEGASTAADPGLVQAELKEHVAAGLKIAGFAAEPGADLVVTASDGPNRVDLALDDAFAEFSAHPERQDEIVAAAVDEARQRLDEGVSGLSFDEVRGDVMPLLKRSVDLRRYGFEPLEGEFAGNLTVVYVVDGDDAYTVIRPEDAERWGTTVDELHRIALRNLTRQTNAEEELVCEPLNGQELCGWGSSDGYDATRMIVPALRRQIVREYGGAAAYAVPMDNVFVALPLELLEHPRTRKLFRAKVEHDFQTSETPLSPEVYVERDGKLVPWK
jgi:uncharacterized protein YtpQ (UPF0354 family)